MTILPVAHALLILATRMTWAMGYQHAPADVLSAIVRHAKDETEVALAVEWAQHESQFSNFPKAWSSDARSGKAQCYLQVHASGPLTLDECAQRWFAALHQGDRYCGSLEGSLRLLSSGRCDGAHRLVATRLDEALFLRELASTRPE